MSGDGKSAAMPSTEIREDLVRTFVATVKFCSLIIFYTWRGGPMCRALHLQPSGDGFDFQSRRGCVSTLGKWFTATCLRS